MKPKCKECATKVAVAWYKGAHVCNNCYNNLKRRGKISVTALSRLNARIPNDF